MKICIVSQTFAPQAEGGAEISARAGATELAKKHDVTVLALGKSGDPLVPPGETRLASNVRVVRLPWKNSYLPGHLKPSVNFARRAAWHLRTAFGALCVEGLTEFFRRENFNLIYAQNSSYMQPAIFHAAEDAGIPICLHLRDYALLCPKTSMFRREDNCATPCFDCSLINRRLRLRGNGMTVIAVSNFVKQRFVENGVLAEADWHVMHNKNTPLQSFDTSIIGRAKPADQTFTFGYLGALAKEKGVPDLIEAFKASAAGSNARLVIAGRGRPGEEDTIKRLGSEANVEFRGYVTPQEIYRMADAVVVPSQWHEPQSRILVEAGVYGVPVISSNRGGTPEIVEAEKTGWCYDPEKPGALAKLLEKAVSIGPETWWQKRDELFPGIASFDGTAEQSGYYEKLERILTQAAIGQTA
ncbi:glycosyltransferase [Agrobacterium larrymoorei]|uniref:glycosyltransferase n=1 Tax=Agrobacterium larrymoorei TaxID=160699 RepID=UPI0030C2D208